MSYNLTGWLEKNKDPLNDTIVEMIKNGSNALMIQCFADHPGQPIEAKKDDGARKKKGGGKTVSSYFKGDSFLYIPGESYDSYLQANLMI